MFGNLGGGEILVILLFVLIFFGPKKIPDIAQSLGKGIREFKKATRDIQDAVEKEVTQVKDAGGMKEVKELKEIAESVRRIPKP